MIISKELKECARVNPMLFRRAKKSINANEFIDSVVKAGKTTRENVSITVLTNFYNRVKG